MAGSTAAKLRPFGVEGPWAVLVSVAGVAGYELVLGGAETSDPAWQPTATLREIVVDQLTPDTLLPIFAAFWRVFGHERPGNWSPPT